jgi:hypothetical protein
MYELAIVDGAPGLLREQRGGDLPHAGQTAGTIPRDRQIVEGVAKRREPEHTFDGAGQR